MSSIAQTLLSRPGLQATPALSKAILDAIRAQRKATPLDGLDATKPILLAPLRLQTRFVHGGLWIRAYPDAVSIDQHQRLLTEREQQDGARYVDAATRDPEQAWAVLLAGHTTERAAWIAKACDAATGARGSPRASAPIARPVARGLPERLVFITVSATADPGTGEPRVRTVVGEPIPDPLPMGPDPAKPGAILDEHGELAFGGDLQWLAKPEIARDKGMAVFIADLEAFEQADGFATITALGVRLAEDASGQAELLGELLAAHRYGAGLSITRQGTPTNASGTPGASRATPPAPGPTVPGGDGPRHYDLESDAERLTHALGLPTEALAGISGAEAQDGAEAIAMARALWMPTLGCFLSTLIGDALTPETIDKVRDMFTYHVGTPLPAIRVGSQPYGVLPATRFAALAFPEPGWDFHDGLRDLLTSVKRAWDGRTDEVARVGADNDPDATLLGILRQNPASVRFAQTRLVGANYRKAALKWRGASKEQAAMEERADIIKAVIAVLNAKEVIPDAPLRSDMLIFDLAERWRQDLNPLLDGAPVEDGVPLSESSPLQPMPSFNGNYIEWLLTANPADVLAENIVGNDGLPITPPRALLYMLLRQAWLLEHTAGAARNQLRRRKTTLAALLTEPVAANLVTQTTPGFLELLGSSLGRGVGGARNIVELMAREDNRPRLGDAVDTPFRERWSAMAAKLADGDRSPALVASAGALQYFDGLGRLAHLPTARLERLMTERLDACASRIDAWMTGLTGLKLLALRAQGNVRRLGDQSLDYPKEKKGLYLGAYGHIESLRPRPREALDPSTLPGALAKGVTALERDPQTAGFVHAPSPQHATTAAILKSGERSHRHAGGLPLRVNLSSRRIRVACWLVDGMRNGQDLGALLGYRLERAIHDKAIELEAWLPKLRLAFPTYVEEQTSQQEGLATESVSPRNVTDGLKVVEAHRAGTLDTLLVNAGIKGSAPADEARTRIASLAEDLVDAADAVADLTLAESVHQLAAGNVERAAGVLDAAANATHLPDRFDVAETPFSGRSYSHRLGLLFDAQASTASPWTGGVPVTPRGRADPAINNWLGRVFGDPSKVGANVQLAGKRKARVVALADLGLEPADVLVLLQDEGGGEHSELKTRFALAAVQAAGGGHAEHVSLEAAGKLSPLGHWCLLASSLRSLLFGRRPLGGQHLCSPASVRPEAPDGFDKADIQGRFTASRTAFAAALAKLQKAIDGDKERARVAAQAELSLFGLSHALMPADGLSASATKASAQAIADTAVARLRAADGLAAPRDDGDDAQAGRFVDALRTLLGGAAALTVAFVPPQELGPQVAGAGLVPPSDQALAIDPVETWLIGLSMVRPAVAALLDTRLAVEASDDLGLRPTIWQLPQTDAKGIALPWCALPWDKGDGCPSALSLAMVCATPVGRDGPWRGLLLDAFAETVPDRVLTTGVAFNIDAPGSEPPQALLLAVAPGASWSWDDLLASVDETFEAARRRLVVPTVREDKAEDPDAAYDAAAMIAPLLPAILAPVTAGPTGLALDFMALATRKALTSAALIKDID